jgi:diphthamide biosynthesis protein 2
MNRFEYNGSPARVLFKDGCRKQLLTELERLSLHKPILLSDPFQQPKAAQLATILQGASIKVACTFSEAATHTPTNVTANSVEHTQRSDADSIVSVGGGSSIGLGKTISIRTGLSHIALPTTYAGSEMTPILGETENGRKITRSDPAVRPGVVIYDISYTLDLPSEMSEWCVESSSAHHDHSRTVCIPIMSIPFVARQSPKKAFFCYQGEPGCSFVE